MTSVIYILTLKITHQKLTCLSRLQSALDEIKNAWWWAKNKPNIPGNVKVVSHTVMEMFNSFITTHPLESCLCLDTVKDVWFKFPLRGGLVELSLSAVLTCKQIFYLVCVLHTLNKHGNDKFYAVSEQTSLAKVSSQVNAAEWEHCDLSIRVKFINVNIFKWMYEKSRSEVGSWHLGLIYTYTAVLKKTFLISSTCFSRYSHPHQQKGKRRQSSARQINK